MRYRKKPVVIEAIQFKGSVNTNEVFAWAEVVTGDDSPCMQEVSGNLAIETLEGTMTANPGDWIICGVQGELYPCKPDIFEQTYEPAPEPPQ